MPWGHETVVEACMVHQVCTMCIALNLSPNSPPGSQ